MLHYCSGTSPVNTDVAHRPICSGTNKNIHFQWPSAMPSRNERNETFHTHLELQQQPTTLIMYIVYDIRRTEKMDTYQLLLGSSGYSCTSEMRRLSSLTVTRPLDFFATTVSMAELSSELLSSILVIPFKTGLKNHENRNGKFQDNIHIRRRVIESTTCNRVVCGKEKEQDIK